MAKRHGTQTMHQVSAFPSQLTGPSPRLALMETMPMESIQATPGSTSGMEVPGIKSATTSTERLQETDLVTPSRYQKTAVASPLAASETTAMATSQAMCECFPNQRQHRCSPPSQPPTPQRLSSPSLALTTRRKSASLMSQVRSQKIKTRSLAMA